MASFCLELTTFIVFRRMNDQLRKEYREDYKLLGTLLTAGYFELGAIVCFQCMR